MASDGRDRITPVDAAYGSTDYVPDERLPMLAAAWLAEGWSSDALLELASMSAVEARTDARRLLPNVFDSLGVRAIKTEEDKAGKAADRYAALVAWAVREMDGLFTPYSVAQKVLEVVDDDPAVFDALPGTQMLREKVSAVDHSPGASRAAAQDELRRRLLALADSLGVGRG